MFRSGQLSYWSLCRQQGMVAGLQVFDTEDGQWHTVEPIQDALVINVGDMAQVCSWQLLWQLFLGDDCPMQQAPLCCFPMGKPSQAVGADWWSDNRGCRHIDFIGAGWASSLLVIT